MKMALRMLGDVVKLFLCRNCRGLFVLDSQVEKHVISCNGNAYKSPANLFACEREHFLELIAPITNVTSVVADEQKSRLALKRKRRKTDPQAFCEIESQITNNLQVRDDSNLPNSVSDDIPETSNVWHPATESISCNQASSWCHGRSHLGNASWNLQDSPVDNLLLNNSNTTEVSKRVEKLQSLDSCVVSIAQNENTPSSSCSVPVNSTTYSSHLELDTPAFEQEERFVWSVPGNEEIQDRNTPATNFLAYLHRLQHGSKTQSNGSSEGNELASDLDVTSLPTSETCNFYISDEIVSLETTLAGPNFGSIENKDVTDKEHNHVKVQDLSESDKFLFGAEVAVLETGNFGDREKDRVTLTGAGEANIPFLPEEDHMNVKDKETVKNSDEVDFTNFREEVETSPTFIQIQEMSNQIRETYSLKSAANDELCSDELSTQRGNKTAEGVFNNEVSSDLMYILEPSNLLQSVTLADIVVGRDVNSSIFTLPNDASCSDVINQNKDNVQTTPFRLDSKWKTTPSFASMCEATTEFSLNTGVSDDDGNARQVVTKAKSKNQIRLDELRVLREEILNLSTEIPPDAESKKTRYRCNVCGHVAKSVKFMHNHLQMHSDGKVYFECDLCDYKSKRRCKVIEHQQRHNQSRLLCHLCPATFKDAVSLNRHINAKHTDNPDLQCNQCDFRATHANDLKEHMLKHTGEFLQCEVEGCQYKTPYLRALRLHQKRHACEKKYQCHLCDYRFVEKCGLDRHMRSHTQERPFQCSSCPFRANTKYGVLVHMQHQHQEQKEVYACDKCPFRTAYAGSMAKHVKTHLGAFACPLCAHSCGSLLSIKRHVREVHQLDGLTVVDGGPPINVRDYLQTPLPPDKPLMETIMPDSIAPNDDLSPLTITSLDPARIDPMKLSFHFHDLPSSGPLLTGNSGTSLTRSSSIPDLFTYSGMHRSSSQSDFLNFSGMTRSNSMSDLVTFASSMCGDSGDGVGMDVSLADASGPALDVGGLSPGEGGGVVLGLQCSRCLKLLINDLDVDDHRKACAGTVQLV